MYNYNLFVYNVQWYQEPILLIGEIMVKYVSFPRFDHVHYISAESKYSVTFQNEISICPSYSPSTGQHILVLSRFIAQCLYETSNDIYTTE